MKINELQAKLDAKNSYYDLYKTDLAKTKKLEEERIKNASTLSYDKVFQMYDDKIAGSTKYEHRVIEKKKRGSSVQRSDQVGIVLSGQQYGWRKPIDNLDTGQKHQNVCVRTFMDYGHI